MRRYMSSMLVFAIITSPALSSAEVSTGTSSPASSELRNVELSKDGTLLGQVLTESGLPGSAKIAVHSQTDLKTVARFVATDDEGKFAVTGLRGGRCVFTVGTDTFVCRVWSHGTAPPKSIDSVAIVPTSGVVLGNNCNNCAPQNCGGLRNKLACMSGTQKALLIGGIAAAIAIPIALDDDDDAS